ncbi:TlpA family protein disulfide reductase [Aquimarina sp. AD10]|uniref:peroxiredoxin family protein n=1 Tax=Aquimarina TaxID=290174 RepID=UPI000E4C9C1F|nr:MULTISPECIES: TlpA disulfide reductase family protein [Aquimarina]AXT59139.1 TlpA family protein disulfide reductase [Aquimarina sp. AD10]RKM93073.1 TlpA family protein disulfide reductase [Aquimarina sp. AD10]
MKQQIILSILLVLIISSCKKEQTQERINFKSGPWRAELELQDNKKLPFLFEVMEDQTLKIFNAEEIIDVEDISIDKDSIRINFPVFEGYVAAKFIDSITISGSFIKESLNRIVPFKAAYGVQDRFKVNAKPSYDITGNWETIFSKDSDEDRYIAKGIFKQNGNIVTGTFRTTTGDYRYLEGVLNNDILELSAFDGAHAFLFTAKVTDSTLNGHFYSGNHWKEPFTSKKNASYELPSADSLTFLNEGYDSLAFSFPDVNGNIVSLNDDRFKDKVVIVQVMGTWCPNCMDETKYYVEYYNRNKDKDVAFIALAFEYAKTQEKAFTSIKRLQSKLKVEYPVLLAQYGTSDKKKAQEKLPMLNHVLSYPTSIFIDKKGQVRKIHTGFNGPATGDKYLDFKKEFESFIDQLLSE